MPIKEELVTQILDRISQESTQLNVITQKVISFFENGEPITDTPAAIEIAKLMELDVSEIFSRNFNRARIPSEIQKKSALIREVDLHYKNYLQNSYAIINNITTISKLRINKPKNKMDPIGKISISNDLKDKIDKEITKKFTMIQQ